MKPSEVCTRAVMEIVKPDGWTQGTYGEFWQADGPVCATGAIARVVGAAKRNPIRESELFESLPAEAQLAICGISNHVESRIALEIVGQGGYRTNPSYIQMVARWNDGEANTQADVAAVLLDVANKFRELGE